MTKELAIRILTGDVLGTTEQTQEAVTMAVKALSHPDVPDKNVGDTIYRHDAIDALKNNRMLPLGDHPAYNRAMRDSENVIRNLPSAQPERETAKFIRWMECEETAKYISYTPHCKCSKCGTEFLIETIKYCYMCGARMER